MSEIDWEHAPEFSKMEYEELEAHAMKDWYDLAYANDRIAELEQKVEDLEGMLGELPPEGKCAMLLVKQVGGEYIWRCEKYDFASYCLVDSEADTYTGMTLNDPFGRADFADKLTMAKELRRMAASLEARGDVFGIVDVARESYGQVSEQAKRKNGGERESCGEVCGDDRFELIGKAKRKLLECTNIESRPDEVAVLDNVLFRCWQMGWLDQLRDDDSRYSELFGTPERAARTIANICSYHGSFDCSYGCPADGSVCGCGDYDALLEWLRGEGEGDA